MYGTTPISLNNPVKLTGNNFSLVFEFIGRKADEIGICDVLFNISKDLNGNQVSGHMYSATSLDGNYALLGDWEFPVHAFTVTNQEEITSSINYGELSYLETKTSTERGYATINVSSTNIPDNTDINVVVKSDNVNVTNKFNISGNKIINNTANIKISVPLDVKTGEYLIELTDSVTNKTTITKLTIPEEKQNNNEENNNYGNKQNDNTIADKRIPNAGKDVILIFAITSICILAIGLYIVKNKYKSIN